MPKQPDAETATKRELVTAVAASTGTPQNEVADIVQTTLDSIMEALSEGERLEIRNFGVFEVRTRDARTGRNPRTGQIVPIEKKRVASFRPGKALKERVEESGQSPAPPVPTDQAPEQHQSPRPGEPEGGQQQKLF